MKKIAVLGATGSIGKSTLDIINRDKDNFEIVLLSAHNNKKELEILSKEYPKALCILTSSPCGNDKLLSAIAGLQPDITVNGISGAAGLLPSFAAVKAGSDLALANKETAVMAGQLLFRIAKEKNVNIIPVDSEHSAIFKLISAHAIEALCEIMLTASGGPFRKLSLKEMEKVTAEDALSHPTWNMGPKITIDSASMANKGLEIIEACVFFNLPQSKIKVIIHPQSIVHSMIKLKNGIIYAQLSKPDMRCPIHDALYYPHTAPLNLDPLNFDFLNLEFEKPDTEKFPMLTLARTAAEKGSLYPCAYNAANEEAVKEFMNKKIGFLDIPRITESVLNADWNGSMNDIESILEADKKAREKAITFISKIV